MRLTRRLAAQLATVGSDPVPFPPGRKARPAIYLEPNETDPHNRRLELSQAGDAILREACGLPRSGPLGSNVGGRFMRWVYPARDGLVSVLLLFGTTFGPYTARPGIREVIAFVLLATTLLVLSSRARPGEVF